MHFLRDGRYEGIWDQSEVICRTHNETWLLWRLERSVIGDRRGLCDIDHMTQTNEIPWPNGRGLGACWCNPIKKYIHLGAISAFVPSFWLLLGPPLTAHCELLKISGRKKVLSLRAAISAAKQRSQKVLLLRKSNLNFGQNAKSGGAYPFMAVN